MFTSVKIATRSFSSSRQVNSKVAVMGAAGGIGQPLSLLLASNPHITHLSLYDVVNTPGVGADLSHINGSLKVSAHTGPNELESCLSGCEVVVIPAGVPRKPGMTRDDLFNTNASIVQTLANACAKYCPKAKLAIISNPVNSTVPIASEAFKAAGCHDPKRIFGVTTLDVVRANKFVGDLKGSKPEETNVPVIGGHAGITILPLLSQTTPPATFTGEELEKLTIRIQNAGTEVVEAKAGTGSATLSMAYAGARFADSLLRAAAGEKVVECAYVESDVIPECKYFSTPVELGPDGVKSILGYGTITEYEQTWLDKLVPQLKTEIAKGENFGK